MVAIIVAYDNNRVIGKDGKLPWRLPEDLRLFRERTMGHTVVMGRKTWESLPPKVRPLPGRRNWVVTNSPARLSAMSIDQINACAKADDGTSLQFMDWEDLHNLWLKVAKEQDRKVFIIGGASVYKQALDDDLVDMVIASEVEGEHEGDARFPLLGDEWHNEGFEAFDGFTVRYYVKRS